MKINLKVWRQESTASKGKIVDYVVDDISGEMSFLEMLDVLNLKLVEKGEVPVAFDHDCR
ncbi:MAG: succinate dehydrogenase/fumarate reductase iron-sulfur subunit, partial [Bacteroidia bacterium]|nr:succinate dehydrogenase/fumarate reductase iron-sulfur subunit [Bacteroidia bacterium]